MKEYLSMSDIFDDIRKLGNGDSEFDVKIYFSTADEDEDEETQTNVNEVGELFDGEYEEHLYE